MAAYSEYEFEIGTTEVGMTSLIPLVTLAPGRVFIPFASFQEFNIEVEAADALVYGHGWGLAQWRWGFFPVSLANTLRSTYCTGKSAEAYIKTLANDGTYDGYHAVMIWPEQYLISNDFIIDFVIDFRLLEAL
jgi:hypothetical protein